jgi:hypothetical protein
VPDRSRIVSPAQLTTGVWAGNAGRVANAAHSKVQNNGKLRRERSIPTTIGQPLAEVNHRRIVRR